MSIFVSIPMLSFTIIFRIAFLLEENCAYDVVRIVRTIASTHSDTITMNRLAITMRNRLCQLQIVLYSMYAIEYQHLSA